MILLMARHLHPSLRAGFPERESPRMAPTLDFIINGESPAHVVS
ncbi:hypothetical protein [Pseudomonas chaetocerotis]|jgi:hypothetical protein|nr:hypothetical protein [Pseudomonas chaetocerotis]